MYLIYCYSYTARSVLPSVVGIPSPFFGFLTIYIKLKIMKHILNNLTEQEKNSIREQHTGGMKVMTENFSKLINSKLGDVKPILAEQDLIGMANQILSGSGDSDAKVKEFCDLCKKEKVLDNRYRVLNQGKSASSKADEIRDALQGVGTDEESIYRIFESLSSFDEFCFLVKAYKDSYWVDLHTDLSSDISDESEWVRIMRPIRNLVNNIPYHKSQKVEKQTPNAPTAISGITYDNKTNTYRRPDGR